MYSDDTVVCSTRDSVHGTVLEPHPDSVAGFNCRVFLCRTSEAHRRHHWIQFSCEVRHLFHEVSILVRQDEDLSRMTPGIILDRLPARMAEAVFFPQCDSESRAAQSDNSVCRIFSQTTRDIHPRNQRMALGSCASTTRVQFSYGGPLFVGDSATEHLAWERRSTFSL